MAYCECDDGSQVNPNPGKDDSSPNIGDSTAPHDTVDVGRSRCFGARPVIQVWEGQKTRLRLYLQDANGTPINIADGTTVYFEARDREASRVVRFRQKCTVESAAQGKVLCSVPASVTRNKPGIYVAQLLNYASDGVTLLHATNYWFVANMTVDSAFSNTCHTEPITVAEIRLFLRDVCPEQNFLLDDLEFDDSQILGCIRLPINEFNEKYEPQTRYTMRNFPFRFHWIRATMGYLMEIAAHGYARDHLPYSAGGVSVDDKNKAETYIRIAKTLLEEWRQFIREAKWRLNTEGGFGRLGSSYRFAYWY